MFIDYSKAKGYEYGTVKKSIREEGKTKKIKVRTLGRVIDKERGIFRSLTLGLYCYDLATDTVLPVPDGFEPPKTTAEKLPPRQILSISFGDVFFLDEYLKKTGFIRAVDAIDHKNPDTLHALLSFYILCSLANCHAENWWEVTYARYLYPKANLASQRVSEVLKDIGSEDAKRKFFKEYFRFLERRAEATDSSNGITDGILIDSSGLPNAIHFPLTAINNHNGVISEEVRLIYVVQQHTGMPLFFRYVAGNVVDVSTIKRTIAELKANGVNTKFAILDAGYYTGINADALLDAGVSFMARMKGNFKVYKDAVRDHLGELEAKENAVIFHHRLVYVKCIECRIGQKEDRQAYAYLCKDMTMSRVESTHAIEYAVDKGLSGEDVFDEIQRLGVFVLVSTRKLVKENVLSLYYMRDRVEKIFEICKQGGKILPVSVQSEATFRGHLMMTFMATAILKMMSDVLRNTSLTTETALFNLSHQNALVYENELITNEPVKLMNEAYKAFGIECPVSIPLKRT